MEDQKQNGAPSQDKGRRDPREGGNGKRYEGFEGMNYEQPRQPYGKAVSNKRPGNNQPSSPTPNQP